MNEGENQPPIAEAAGPYSGYANYSVTFSGASSRDFEDCGSIEGYRWDFENDGTWDTEWLTAYSTEHTYTIEGSHIVKLEVKDDEGATANDTASVEITILNRDPVANCGGPYLAVSYTHLRAHET